MRVTMAGHLPNGAMFTVEQIELIRRLRNSGISKEQIVHVFESFERLDQELGPMYYIPNPMMAHSLMSQVHMAAQAAQLQMANQASQMVAAPGIQASLQQAAEAAKKASTPQAHQPQAHTPLPPPQGPTVEEIQALNGLHSNISPQELEEKLKEFIGKGDQACCEEIREFVQKHQIRQQQVAILAGISQPYVSRFLKGDFRDMSARSRHAIHRWYLLYKDMPDLAAVDYTHRRHSDVNPYDTGASPRRERFVFRPKHVEILEQHFEEDSYPTQEKKEEIAMECNAALEATAGRILNEKERVNAQVVGTWFANKRKDLKKIAREEGLEAELTWRPRGRPRQWTGDSSPLPPGSLPPVSMPTGPFPAGPLSAGPSTAGQPPSGPIPAGHISNGPHPTPPVMLGQEADDQSVARAVEEAAVSQAISSITGQWMKMENGNREHEPQALSPGEIRKSTPVSQDGMASITGQWNQATPINGHSQSEDMDQEMTDQSEDSPTEREPTSRNVASITGQWIKVEATPNGNHTEAASEC